MLPEDGPTEGTRHLWIDNDEVIHVTRVQMIKDQLSSKRFKRINVDVDVVSKEIVEMIADKKKLNMWYHSLEIAD
ncbi:hypothetical protein Tco_1276417 [Tanacetum coccineum]